MKADITRNTFDSKKHFSSVRMQQGRVQIDADWNEQIDIIAHRVESETRDVIGLCGAPMHNAGFALTNGTEPHITAGHYYVDGILCENEQEIPLHQQTDQPGYTLPETAGLYLAYVDVWQQHLTALEIPQIREVALGGPDTATRTKTIWQVKLLGPLAAPLNCLSVPQQWTDLIAPSTGMLTARVQPSAVSDNPCTVEPGAGYRRLENQLYRVEIHQAGDRANATFKWSRDNGSIVTQWLDQNGDDLIVSSIGRDKVLGFAPGQWVELTDDTRELNGQSGTLVQLVNAEGQILKINPATATGSVNQADFPNNPKVRRWDSQGQIETDTSEWIALEDGIEVKFEAGSYKIGDYWLIPARTATGNIEWPQDDSTPPQPLPQFPPGIQHHYCRLAVIERDASGQFQVLEDCRQLFPPVTELTSFFYVGGDGQESMPGDPLPQLLQVGVANGRWPVNNARVRFVAQGNGRVAQDKNGLASSTSNTIEVLTGADGIASCAWRLDADVNNSSQQVVATLLNNAGTPTSHIPIRFTANLSIAQQVFYNPAACNNLSGITTVQGAIDKLCQSVGGGRCTVTVGKGGEYEQLNEAIKGLLSQGQTDICICMLPGEHRMVEGLSIAGEDRDISVKITGCGSGTRIFIEQQPWKLQRLASFTLKEVEMQFINMQSPISLEFEQCDEVTFASCHLMQVAGKEVLLAIGEADRIHIENNVIEAYLTNSFDKPKIVFDADKIVANLFNVFDRKSFNRRVLVVADYLARLNLNERQIFLRNLRNRLNQRDIDLSDRERESYLQLLNTMESERINRKLLVNLLENIRAVAAHKVPGTAIVIQDGEAETTLENNQILGVLSLYGIPGETELRDGTISLSLLENLLKEGRVRLLPSRQTLQILNNRFTRLTLAEEMVQNIIELTRSTGGELVGLYKMGFLTDNTFQAGHNQFLARHLAFNSNYFDSIDGQPGSFGFLGTAISEVATFTSNHSVNSDFVLFNVSQENEKAVNIRMTIS